MSNDLAVATVTAVLRDVVAAAVANSVDGKEVAVVAGGPNADASKNPVNGVTVFLFQVTPNAALRNQDLPMRRADGGLVQKPVAALDLHYLLTFYGDAAQLIPERLLGRTVAALHAQPVLTPQLIEATVATAAGGTEPFLSRSDLAAQPELVKFTPLSMAIDDLSRIWSVFFQTPYRLSVAYKATVVLVESDETPEPALPVRSRGLEVLPLGRPTIEGVAPLGDPREPVLVGTTLQLRGHGLAGPNPAVRIGGPDGWTAEPSSVSDETATVVLDEPPFPDGTLRAGVQSIQLLHRAMMGEPATPRPAATSNAVPFVLRPRITNADGAGELPVTDVTSAEGRYSGTIEVATTPAVGPGQEAVILLNPAPSEDGVEAAAFVAPSREGPQGTLEFAFHGLREGSYLVRVAIDGAESPMAVEASGTYAAPRVVIA